MTRPSTGSSASDMIQLRVAIGSRFCSTIQPASTAR
jgi:hypothetical protein